MTAPVLPTLDFGPDWVTAEMPPGYANRVAEIRRLAADLEDMSRFGRLLSETGAPLARIVREVFTSLGFESEVNTDATTDVAVKLDTWKRLLIHVSADGEVVQKKGAEISRVFQVLHEHADEHDRVVFVTNVDPARRPADRGEALTAEAQAFLGRMGVSHVTAPTLFALWKLSLQEPGRARQEAQRLHAYEGGTFHLSPGALAI